MKFIEDVPYTLENQEKLSEEIISSLNKNVSEVKDVLNVVSTNIENINNLKMYK